MCITSKNHLYFQISTFGINYFIFMINCYINNNFLSNLTEIIIRSSLTLVPFAIFIISIIRIHFLNHKLIKKNYEMHILLCEILININVDFIILNKDNGIPNIFILRTIYILMKIYVTIMKKTKKSMFIIFIFLFLGFICDFILNFNEIEVKKLILISSEFFMIISTLILSKLFFNYDLRNEIYFNLFNNSKNSKFLINKSNKNTFIVFINNKCKSLLLNDKNHIPFFLLKEFFKNKFSSNDKMYKHLITDFPKMTNYMNRDEKKLLDLKKQKDINSYIDIENMINIFSHHHILNFNIEVMFCEFENQKEKKNYILSFKLIKIQNDEFFYFSLKEPKENINITLENQKKYEEFNLRLLSSYSHELKTPINGAIPSLEILQNDLNFNKENKNKKQLKLIMTSLKILQNSIDNIFDYSSFSNNQFYLNKKSFFLINLINEISEIIESKIDNIKVKYVQIIDPYILNKKIFNDYSRLRQLLLNLLLNSIQFTLNGTIKLKINFKNSKTIDFTVEDTGIGINQHRLQQILDKITCDQYLNIESTSSCLGLIISQKLACLLGNNEGLKIESKLGSGSLFNFNISNNENFHHSIDLTKNACNSKSSLKFDEVIQNSIQNSFIITKKSLEIKENFNKEFCTHQNFDKSNEIIQAQKEKYVSNSLKRISHKRHSILSANHINEEKQQISELSLNLVIESKLETDNDCDCAKILIVDDDMFNLMVLERLLNTLKFKCLKATNGKDAIDLLSSQKCLKCKGIKLIFMDYQMPIMDGIEATVQINKLIEDKIINYVVIIGCTAFTSKDYVLKCYEVGMKTVIFKPLNINIIKETLDQWLLDK